MYGVVVLADEERSDLKVFDTQADAQSWFNRLVKLVGRGGFRSISMYSVPDARNARDAANAIKAHDKGRLILLRIEKAGRRWAQWPDATASKKIDQDWGYPNT